MNNNFFFIFIMCLFSAKVNGQYSNNYKSIYSFTLINGGELTTMKQINENYLSANRILCRLIDDDEAKVDDILKFMTSFLGLIITHEEGHRSVLTNLEIGSISQPFSIFEGVAYVKGVTDETLINLRQNNFHDYIRLHTAGLESDYMVTNKIESLIALELDDYKNLRTDYLVHKLSQIGYFISVFVPKISPNLKEEDSELERDIVGHDVFGAIRHLYRPNMEFYRYTNFGDLTKKERKFATKISLLSFLNLANPIVFGKTNFKVNERLKMNAGLGYTLSPFGGFIDENIWLIINDNIKIHSYFRQFHNENDWFLGGGCNLINYSMFQDKLILNGGIDLWSQPKNLSFTEGEGDLGYGINMNLGYKVYDTKNNKQSIYLNGGLSYKEAGFIPEYASLDGNTKFNFGLSLAW